MNSLYRCYARNLSLNPSGSGSMPSGGDHIINALSDRNEILM